MKRVILYRTVLLLFLSSILLSINIGSNLLYSGKVAVNKSESNHSLVGSKSSKYKSVSLNKNQKLAGGAIMAGVVVAPFLINSFQSKEEPTNADSNVIYEEDSDSSNSNEEFSKINESIRSIPEVVVYPDIISGNSEQDIDSQYSQSSEVVKNNSIKESKLNNGKNSIFIQNNHLRQVSVIVVPVNNQNGKLDFSKNTNDIWQNIQNMAIENNKNSFKGMKSIAYILDNSNDDFEDSDILDEGVNNNIVVQKATDMRGGQRKAIYKNINKYESNNIKQLNNNEPVYNSVYEDGAVQLKTLLGSIPVYFVEQIDDLRTQMRDTYSSIKNIKEQDVHDKWQEILEKMNNLPSDLSKRYDDMMDGCNRLVIAVNEKYAIIDNTLHRISEDVKNYFNKPNRNAIEINESKKSFHGELRYDKNSKDNQTINQRKIKDSDNMDLSSHTLNESKDSSNINYDENDEQ